MNDQTTIHGQQETAQLVELEINHDYDLIRAYAEQLNGQVEVGEENDST